MFAPYLDVFFVAHIFPLYVTPQSLTALHDPPRPLVPLPSAWRIPESPLATSFLLWTQPRPSITSGTSASMTALWTTHPLESLATRMPHRPLPSPKRSERYRHASSSKDDDFTRRGLSRRLRIEGLRCDPLPPKSTPFLLPQTPPCHDPPPPPPVIQQCCKSIACGGSRQRPRANQGTWRAWTLIDTHWRVQELNYLSSPYWTLENTN